MWSLVIYVCVSSCVLNPDSDASVRHVRTQVEDGDYAGLIFMGSVACVSFTRQAMQAGDDVLVVMPGLGQVRNQVVLSQP